MMKGFKRFFSWMIVLVLVFSNCAVFAEEKTNEPTLSESIEAIVDNINIFSRYVGVPDSYQ